MDVGLGLSGIRTVSGSRKELENQKTMRKSEGWPGAV